MPLVSMLLRFSLMRNTLSPGSVSIPNSATLVSAMILPFFMSRGTSTSTTPTSTLPASHHAQTSLTTSSAMVPESDASSPDGERMNTMDPSSSSQRRLTCHLLTTTNVRLLYKPP